MNSSKTRPASHAGSWYTNNPTSLKNEFNEYFKLSSKIENNNSLLKSIIVPHAGYRYSAPTASKAFININPNNYTRCVVIGPSHHEAFHGCGLSRFHYFDTPWGSIPIDIKTNEFLSKQKNFTMWEEDVDIDEHSIEMEMPFIKYIFGDKEFSVLPIMISMTNLDMNREISNSWYDLFKDPNTLFVISSDFCHWGKRFRFVYYDNKCPTIWESTENLDKMGLDIISKWNAKDFDEYIKKYKNTICGRTPITVNLCLIEKYKEENKDSKITYDCVGYAQSEKVTNMEDSSVSYAACCNYIG